MVEGTDFDLEVRNIGYNMYFYKFKGTKVQNQLSLPGTHSVTFKSTGYQDLVIDIVADWN
ncbi:hypothetical protein CD31_21760 [Lysinibacillus boronitolerans JCM 21713 = 10a = NBRC 103108]|uniref:PEGA domain-containing protein n=2 Tax=Lysinibacillus boronitolerans TaxID=309788 RepID=A0ABR4XT80_9BACI|nr:hypothetical protein CD31_21760 [Lysinibacillus boronitolerans JCM 21713 = 10a = NBRC 103108]